MALSRLPLLGWLVRSRWPLFFARAITLAGFLLTILAGLAGSVVGSHNFAVIFVWIAWWTLLKLGFIPLGGRSWCAVCPIPMPGEWLAQGGIFPDASRGGHGLRLAWPVHLDLGRLGRLRLRGAWFQALEFLGVGLFSVVTLTSPRVTGWVLLGILAAATALALVFDGSATPAGTRNGPSGRVFCNSFCPIGGFTGLYAQAAPVEVRVDDLKVCAAHTEKTCAAACPWGVYVAAQRENGPCGLCMECLRACPKDNVSFNLRAFGADLVESRKLPRLDETYLALVMLSCGMAFSAIFLGPWGGLRRAAYAVGSPDWWLFAAVYLLLAGLALPGLFALALRLAGLVRDWRTTLARATRPLIPLGLAAWIAFTVSFSFAKVSYILPVLSDPFGLGWNLFGTAHLTFAPDVSAITPLLQAGVLLVGMLVMGKIARRDAITPRQAVAVQGFGLLVTLGMLALLLA